MDSLIARYRKIIETIYQEYIDFMGEEEGIQFQFVFDQERDRDLLIEVGWQDGDRIYGTFLHLDICDGKVWIQHDGTEEGIAYELEAAGIPKHRIVLAFKPLSNRQIIPEYAIS